LTNYSEVVRSDSHAAHIANKVTEEQVIVTLKDLAIRLGVSSDTAKGMAWGIGVEIHVVGTALALSEADAKKVEREARKRPIPLGHNSRRQPVSA
jgi:hypothetical protein